MVFVIFQDDADYYWARSRVLERMNVAAAAAARRASCRSSAPTPPRWARSTGTRSRPRGPTWPSSARCRTGTSATSSRRSRASREVASRRRLRQAVPDRRPPRQAPRPPRHAARGLRGGPQEQHRRRRQGRREQRLRVLHPRRRLRQDRRGHREHRHPPGGRHADLRQERGHGAARPGVPPRRRSTRPAARRSAASSLMRYGENPLRGHRAGQGEDRADRAGPAGTTLADGRQVAGPRSSPSTTAPSIIYETMDTLREALTEEALRRGPRRRHLPAAPAQLAGDPADAAAVGGAELHRHVLAGRRQQHHVAGRASPSPSATWPTWASS